jgi:hypothetical protein
LVTRSAAASISLATVPVVVLANNLTASQALCLDDIALRLKEAIRCDL